MIVLFRHLSQSESNSSGIAYPSSSVARGAVLEIMQIASAIDRLRASEEAARPTPWERSPLDEFDVVDVPI